MKKRKMCEEEEDVRREGRKNRCIKIFTCY